MTPDTPEPLGQRADLLARLRKVDPDEPGIRTRWMRNPDGHDAAREIEALAAANAALVKERDALREEWVEIAAGLTDEQPEVGALWPLVSEVSGALSASRNLFRNEIAAHNRTKTERDAALARAERLEAENADLKISVIAFCAPVAVDAARDWRLPANHLLPHHYDILEKAGARMASFTRAALATEPQS